VPLTRTQLFIKVSFFIFSFLKSCKFLEAFQNHRFQLNSYYSILDVNDDFGSLPSTCSVISCKNWAVSSLSCSWMASAVREALQELAWPEVERDVGSGIAFMFLEAFEWARFQLDSYNSSSDVNKPTSRLPRTCFRAKLGSRGQCHRVQNLGNLPVALFSINLLF
jgi:hypothetical protein